MLHRSAVRRSIVLCFAMIALATRPLAAQTFHDDFNGTALDSALWTTDAGSGQIVVAGGAVTLSCSGPTFPVVMTRSDPFPPGDFVVRVGMRYVSQGYCGDGLGTMDNFWADYYGTACRPFLLWQDTAGLYVYTGSSGPTGLAPSPELGYHVYEWLYTGGAYQFSMDGVVRASGACAPRATSIFFGHPHPIGCGGPWSSFSIDFIDVSPLLVTPARASTWGALKLVYR